MKNKNKFYIVGRQYLDCTTYLYANGEFILWGVDIVSGGKFKPQLFSNKKDAESYMKRGDGYTTFLKEVYIEFPQVNYDCGMVCKIKPIENE